MTAASRPRRDRAGAQRPERNRGGLPLHGVFVVDATDGRGGSCGRYLADLGADVLLLEPPGGSPARGAPPFGPGGESLSFALQHAGKRSLCVDIGNDAGRDRVRRLLADADIFIVGERLAAFEAHGLGPAVLRRDFPDLVTLSITEFGRAGPLSGWRGTDPVQVAMSGLLSRSGLPRRPPLIPPGAMAHEAAGVQAAWAALLSYWRRLRDGVGDDLDFSIHDSTVQGIDPHFGAGGTAAVAAGAYGAPPPRGRVNVPYYPTFAVRDGFVRIVAVATRQWRALFSWIGEPEEFADPRFNSTATRFVEAGRINKVVGEFFGRFTVAELLAEGQRRGLPIAPVLAIADVLEADHFQTRGSIAEAEFAPGQAGRLPTGYVELDEQRAGFWRRAPMPDELGDEAPASRNPARAARTAVPQPPGQPVLALEGLRVLDLGVIVMGGEAARLFADQGADVLKIESCSFPDGARGDHRAPMHESFAVGHRNLRSVGIDLRSEAGREVFRRFVAKADVLLSNFKPGTLEKLSLGYDALRQINPGLVMVSSSAFGDTGPWSDWMGYGPLVRAASGVTSLWRYEDEPGRFGDPGLTYPDHFVARVVDTAALACLIRRARTGRGAHVRSSQAEAVLMTLGEALLGASLGVADAHAAPDAPWGVFPCQGDDEWCAVTVRDDADWTRLASAVGDVAITDRRELRNREGRLARRAEVNAWLAAWTMRHPPQTAAGLLQAAGVPAGPMQRGPDLLHDPQLAARRQLRLMRQPGLAAEMWVESGPCLSETLAEPPPGPAPMAGENTRAACAEWLDLGDAEVDALIASGALEAWDPPTRGDGHP